MKRNGIAASLIVSKILEFTPPRSALPYGGNSRTGSASPPVPGNTRSQDHPLSGWLGLAL